MIHIMIHISIIHDSYDPYYSYYEVFIIQIINIFIEGIMIYFFIFKDMKSFIGKSDPILFLFTENECSQTITEVRSLRIKMTNR